MNRSLFALIFFLGLTSLVLGQAPVGDGQPSLADFARKNREQKRVKAKTVFTNDSINTARGPIPELRTDATDNSSDIVAAISRFKDAHTPQETEAAVKEWFDGEDSQLAYEYSHSGERVAPAWNRYGSSDHAPTTYQQYNERMLAQARADQLNQQSFQQSAERRANLQSRLLKVRTGIRGLGLTYEWFKVRCGNSDCRY